MKSIQRMFAAASLFAGAFLLTAAPTLQAASQDTGQNKLTKEEKKQGYILLFNGKNLNGWDGEWRDRWFERRPSVQGEHFPYL
jgi:hypothetical protein